MQTNDSSSAPGLHFMRCMKWLPVAILATLSVVGCGVGADEVYGEYGLVLDQQGDALHGSAETRVAAPAAMGTQTFVTSGSTGLRDPGTVALPQDPIPWRDGRTAPQPKPQGEPLLGGPRSTDNTLTR